MNTFRLMVVATIWTFSIPTLQDMRARIFLCSAEALKYIAGYVAHKMRKKYPGQIDLSLPTLPAQGTWIEAKSRGKLVSPTRNLWDITVKYSRLFDQFHGKTIYMGPLPIETLHNLIIQEYGLVEEVDVYAANVFVKVRFFHRIKILNESVKANEAKERLRKMKQKAQFMF